MYAKHPEIAKEFQAATPKGKKLPEHVKKAELDQLAPCFNSIAKIIFDKSPADTARLH